MLDSGRENKSQGRGERRTTPLQNHAAGEWPPRKGLQLEPASSLVAGTRAASWWSGGTWCPRGQREANRSTETSRGHTGVIPGGQTHPGLCRGLTVKGGHAALARQLPVGDWKGLPELQVHFPANENQGGKTETTLQGDRAVNSAVRPMGQRLPLIIRRLHE